MDTHLIFILCTIILALLFDFLNGFHDAPNAIAAIVSTRTLKPLWAVLWAAFFNFIAFLFFGVHVATTVGSGLVHPDTVNALAIFSALIAAVLWNIITWYWGLPSSSSHALIGGLLGAALCTAGITSWQWLGIAKVLGAIILSPIIGMVTGILLMLLITRLCFYAHPRRIDSWFRKLQWVSSALISLGHGSNDAQKTMGIITLLLYSSHLIGDHFIVPIWVVITCNLVMALGTCFGGWRIVKTMGMRITRLKPVSGFSSDTASALTLSAATLLGIPVSTTHTVTGAIIGVGAINGIRAVRWGIAKDIVIAWVLTVPASASVAMIITWMIQ